MNQNKDVKKTLLRNPELPIPKPKPPIQSKPPAKKPDQNAAPAASTSKKPENRQFKVPEMHSILKISEKMNHVAQPRKVKSLPAPCKKLAVDEKVSRKVNFPCCKSVFKDLIPLTNLEAKAQQSVALKTHSYQKDIEPDLRNFMETVKRKEYFCTPKSGLKFKEERRENFGSDGLELFKVVQINNEC